MHRSRSFVTALLSLLLVLSFVAPAFGATQTELNAHRKKAADARKKAAEAEKLAAQLKSETEKLDDEIDRLQARADSLNPKIEEATSRTNRLQGQVNELTAEISALQKQIDKTTAEFERQQGLLADRVEATYKQGTWYYFDLLLGAQGIDDLIARTELVQRVIESNRNIARDLDETKNELTQARVSLDRTRDAVNEKRREASAVEKQLKGLRKERQAAVRAQEAIYNQKSELMAESKANAKRLRAIAAEEEKESDRIAAELSGSGSGYFDGTMAWPVPGFYRVTSPYGYRIHPIFGTKKLHTGIDIGRNADGTSINGAAIVATGDGTVIYAGYRGGYGNTIMIDHGNGVVTLYAHQLSGGMKVGVGAKVQKGQRIGTVGSTGYSTGPHLHFEVRVNGVPKNPQNYL